MKDMVLSPFFFSCRKRCQEKAGRRQVAEDRRPLNEQIRERRRGCDTQLPNNRREEVRRGVAAQ